MTICKIHGQSITALPGEVLASGQTDFARFRFEFSDDWDGLDKTAQFAQNGNTYNMHLGTGTPVSCYMPSEIADGVLYVSVFGVETGGAVVATTAILRLRVLRAGYTDGDDPVEPTPSLYAQLLDEIDKRIADAITDGADGKDGADGADGTSAYIVVAETDTGATITATDANGTTTATITNGADGADGKDGADGQDGADGLSAYEIWLEQGNTGTESDFLAAIKGDKGDTGDTGADGAAGADGKDGADGADGQDGADGYSPTVEVFKQAAAWAIQDGTTAYFNGDTAVTTFDVSSLDSVDLVCWWISSGDSVPLTVTLTDASGNTTTQSLTLSVEESVTLDTSSAATVSIATTGSQRATGQLIYNDETAEGGYYLKITWYDADTDTVETIITDNLKGSSGADGADGADGYSPTATVVQTDTGATITITDKDGTTTAVIANGTSGTGTGLTGGTTDYGTIDITDGVVTLSSAVGKSTDATGAEIFNNYTGNYATGVYSVAMGSGTYATGAYSTATGQYSTASGQNSFAASGATAAGDYSVAMGISCNAGNMYSVALGNTAKVTANHGISIGYYTTASGEYGTAFGGSTTASGRLATAMGQSTKSTGDTSTAMGIQTTASGSASTAMGLQTTASGASQLVIGHNNIDDTDGDYAFVVGNGASATPSNAFTIDWSGNATISGDLIFNALYGGTSLVDSLADSGWISVTPTAGNMSYSEISLEYRTIGKQLYIRGSITSSTTITAGSTGYLVTALIGSDDMSIGGSGSAKGYSTPVLVHAYSDAVTYLRLYFPLEIASGTVVSFTLSGTID